LAILGSWGAYDGLPGVELVEQGLRDLVDGVEPVPALLVSIGAPRLRQLHIEVTAPLAFHHYDFHAQALAKVERGHSQDVADVREMLVRGLVSPQAANRFSLSTRKGLST
jgi:hypothetical protein